MTSTQNFNLWCTSVSFIFMRFCMWEISCQSEGNSKHELAFPEVKLKEKLPCHLYSGDVCACRNQMVCEYNTNTGECLEQEDACNRHFYGEKCRRGGDHVFQVIGGVICNNPVDYGYCGYHIAVFAVNFGDDAPTVLGENGIEYKVDKDYEYEDEGNNRQSVTTDVTVTGISSKEQDLYKYFIYGDSNNGDKDKCVTYYVHSKLYGEYELSIKLAEVEYELWQKRSFNILFNGKYIVQEFEPNRYRSSPNGINLNVNFKILNGNLLAIEGHSLNHIVNNQIPLDFCFGKCSWPGIDINWIASAVSVIKFKPVCDDPFLHSDPCLCHQVGGEHCDFKEHLNHNEYKACTWRGVGCQEFETQENECRRGGNHTFYVDRGIACNIPEASGNCKIDKVMLAVNFGEGAKALTDIYGIEFQKDEGIPFDDPSGSKVESKTDKKIEGIPESDENLYSTYIYGDSCVAYHVPTDGDGEYELSIRIAEFLNVKKRQFAFKFSGLFIQKVFDPLKYKLAFQGMDLIVNFRVFKGGKILRMRGHQDVDISSAGKKIAVEFCPSTCNSRIDKRWFISAFSVVKFES